MYFDRFDILEAWYLFLAHTHEGQWSDSYARLCRLLSYFEPRPNLRGAESLTENGRAIYERLVKP